MKLCRLSPEQQEDSCCRLGNGHCDSWSHIAQTQDVMISLYKYRGIVATGKKR